MIKARCHDLGKVVTIATYRIARKFLDVRQRKLATRFQNLAICDVSKRKMFSSGIRREKWKLREMQHVTTKTIFCVMFHSLKSFHVMQYITRESIFKCDTLQKLWEPQYPKFSKKKFKFLCVVEKKKSVQCRVSHQNWTFVQCIAPKWTFDEIQ